jgi:hypothetical protein
MPKGKRSRPAAFQASGKHYTLPSVGHIPKSAHGHIPRPQARGYTGLPIAGEIESVPGNWYQQETVIWTELANDNPDIIGDQSAKLMYDQAFFEFEGLTGPERTIIRDTLVEYMAKVYGIDIIDEMDWETYRIWYGLSE